MSGTVDIRPSLMKEALEDFSTTYSQMNDEQEYEQNFKLQSNFFNKERVSTKPLEKQYSHPAKDEETLLYFHFFKYSILFVLILWGFELPFLIKNRNLYCGQEKFKQKQCSILQGFSLLPKSFETEYEDQILQIKANMMYYKLTALYLIILLRIIYDWSLTRLYKKLQKKVDKAKRKFRVFIENISSELQLDDVQDRLDEYIQLEAEDCPRINITDFEVGDFSTSLKYIKLKRSAMSEDCQRLTELVVSLNNLDDKCKQLMFEALNKKTKVLRKYEKELENQLENRLRYSKRTKSNNIGIIKFPTVKDRDLFLFLSHSNRLKFKATVFLNRDNINWSCVGYSNLKRRIYFTLFSIFPALLIIAIFIFSSILIKRYKPKVPKDFKIPQEYLPELIAGVSWFLLKLFGGFSRLIIRPLYKCQKEVTAIRADVRDIVLNSIFSFVLFVALFIDDLTILSSDQETENDKAKEICLLLTTFFLLELISLFRFPVYFWSLFTKSKSIKKIEAEIQTQCRGRFSRDEKELILSKPDRKIRKRYFTVISAFLTCCLLSALSPFWFLPALIYFLMCYIIQKLLFCSVYRSKRESRFILTNKLSLIFIVVELWLILRLGWDLKNLYMSHKKDQLYWIYCAVVSFALIPWRLIVKNSCSTRRGEKLLK